MKHYILTAVLISKVASSWGGTLDKSTTPDILRHAVRAGRDALRGQLPDRYRAEFAEEFQALARPALAPGLRILDAGSGRQPTIPVDQRPPGCRYVGLDLSLSELNSAPEGSYDEVVECDITNFVPGLENRFDLVLSFQVLEHVKPLESAMENLRRYLRPGGRLIAQMSGSFSYFGLANRVMPQGTTVWALRKLQNRRPHEIFPAHYHRCWDTALKQMLKTWTTAKVIPVWYGAGYLWLLRPLQVAYVFYEEWARLAGHRNLATYYIVDAVR